MARRKTNANSVSFFAFQDIITSVVGIFVLITLIMALELAQTVEDASDASSVGVSSELLASLASLEASVMQMQAEFDAASASQGAASGLNRFSRDQARADAQTRLQQLEMRSTRVQQDLADIKHSLVEAKKIEKQLLAEGLAAASEREELKTLQDKRRETERYSAVQAEDKPLIFRDETTEGRSVVLVKLEGAEIHVADLGAARTQTFSGASRQSQFASWLAKTELRSRQVFVIVKPTGVDDFEEVESSLNSANAIWGFDVVEQGANFQLRFEMGAAL